MDYRVEEVFATEGVPKYTFITPPNFANILVDLRSPRKPVVFEGASGTGKTSAIVTGLNKSGITNFTLLSSRVPNELTKIRDLITSGRLPSSTTVIDDFHRLTDPERKSVSDLIRAAADNPDSIGGKLIIAGINKAGEQLIAASEDLLKRIGIYRIQPAEPSEALKTLKTGCDLMNIEISNLEDIVNDSQGDYWTIQKMCQIACLNEEISISSKEIKTFTANLANIRNAIIDQLGTLYDQVLKDFVRGSRYRKTNRPYLILLQLFAQANKSSVSLTELSYLFPKQKIRLDVVKKTRLPKLLSSKNLKDKFYYDQSTTIFSVEDPGLSYYIRHLNWKKFAESAGFTDEEGDWNYEIGISFAGEQRDLAKEIAEKLETEDYTVFYDEKADLLGKNLESEFRQIYGADCKYVIAIISSDYLLKDWPAFERAVWGDKVKDSRVFPVFIDDVILKEVSTSICRVDFAAYRSLQKGNMQHADYAKHFDVMIERFHNVVENR
jgi:hypothetical protein